MMTDVGDTVLSAGEQDHDVSLGNLFSTTVAWLQRKDKERLFVIFCFFVHFVLHNFVLFCVVPVSYTHLTLPTKLSV